MIVKSALVPLIRISHFHVHFVKFCVSLGTRSVAHPLCTTNSASYSLQKQVNHGNHISLFLVFIVRLDDVPFVPAQSISPHIAFPEAVQHSCLALLELFSILAWPGSTSE